VTIRGAQPPRAILLLAIPCMAAALRTGSVSATPARRRRRATGSGEQETATGADGVWLSLDHR
jgi:hypothetical protein